MRREWTNEEVRYLERCYERTSADAIAKKLNRTVASVKHKAQKLGLNTYVSDFIRGKALAQCFNSDILVVHRWREKYNLPMKSEKHGQLVFYKISNDDFWKWAETHKEVVPWHKYDRYSIPPEPKWVEQAIRDSMSKKRYRQKVTTTDIMNIRSLLRQGYSYKEIAVQIGRSYDSVKHIVYAHKL